MAKRYKTLRLILGDQLNPLHSWYREKDDSVLYALMEVRTETDYAWHHIQKVCAIFAAMENFAESFSDAGHTVIYIKLDDADNNQNFFDNCNSLIEQYGIEKFEYQLSDEYRVDEALKKYCGTLSIKFSASDTEHFMSEREELGTMFANKENLIMESFYRKMRKKHNVMMEGDVPAGGHWNFDSDNRKKLPKNHKPFPPFVLDNDVTEQYNRIVKAGVVTIGKVDPSHLIWPVNRQQSLLVLEYFIENCLPLFGTFQDAMRTDEWSIYHSRLSFSLNTKQISPAEVVNAAVSAWESNKELIAINQVEGFVRQILGWREYMRGIYWIKMPDFAAMNHFDHNRKMPAWYWTGNTKMNCLRHSIGQSLEHAYAHHIQRLMVTGNFALLAGIHPDDVDVWYLGIYIDAFEWVEITNTRGMSQYADGGITGSKPYTASANYINKMSDYCEKCHYDKKEKIGPKACPFNSLYWDFHDRHRKKLEHHHRLAMVYRIWDNMPPTQRTEVLQQADHYLKNIENL